MWSAECSSSQFDSCIVWKIARGWGGTGGCEIPPCRGSLRCSPPPQSHQSQWWVWLSLSSSNIDNQLFSVADIWGLVVVLAPHYQVRTSSKHCHCCHISGSAWGWRKQTALCTTQTWHMKLDVEYRVYYRFYLSCVLLKQLKHRLLFYKELINILSQPSVKVEWVVMSHPHIHLNGFKSPVKLKITILFHKKKKKSFILREMWSRNTFSPPNLYTFRYCFRAFPQKNYQN